MVVIPVLAICHHDTVEHRVCSDCLRRLNQIRHAWVDGVVGRCGEIERGAVGVDARQFLQFVLVAEDALQGLLVGREWQRNGTPFALLEGLVEEGHIIELVQNTGRYTIVTLVLFGVESQTTRNYLSCCCQACELLLHIVDAVAEPFFQLVHVGLVVGTADVPEASWLLWVSPSLVIKSNGLG